MRWWDASEVRTSQLPLSLSCAVGSTTLRTLSAGHTFWTSSRPGQGRDYLARQARDIQAKVTSLHDGVFNELSRLQSDAESPLIQGAVPHVISVLDNITVLVANATQSGSEPDPGELIQSVLLKSTAVTLDDAWAPMEKPPVVQDAVLALVETPQITWEQAFEHQVERGDHAATRRIVGLLEASGMDAVTIEQLSARRDEAVDERRASLTQPGSVGSG